MTSEHEAAGRSPRRSPGAPSGSGTSGRDPVGDTGRADTGRTGAGADPDAAGDDAAGTESAGADTRAGATDADEGDATRTGEGDADAGEGGAGAGVDTEATCGGYIQDPMDLSDIESFLSGSGVSGKPGSNEAGSDELKGLVAQRDEYLDSLRRLQADFDNYRKRAIRQQTELVDRATEGLLVRLLPVLDSIDLAMAHLPAAREGGDSEAMKSLTQIGTLLRDVLEREGLERIDEVGVPFDPTIHDAVARTDPTSTESEAPDGQKDGAEAGEEAESQVTRPAPASSSSGANSVATVMRSGYRMKGRVLRPAMVAVQG